MTNDEIKKLSFTEFCKETIRTELEKMEGNKTCMCDLAYLLTEEMNVDGTFTYSTAVARDIMREWAWECGEFFDYMISETGKVANPFSRPESFLVEMAIEGVASMISQSGNKLVDKYWDKEVTLTRWRINHIIDTILLLDEEMELF